MSKEESAIDVIYEVRDLLKHQQLQIDLLAKSVSMMQNKLNGELWPDFKGSQAVKPPAGKPVEKEELKPTIEQVPADPEALPPPASKAKPKAKPKIPQPPRKNVTVHGKLQDDSGKNIPAVNVKVMDANNKVIKTTRTNRAGEWRAFLPPGRYAVEFSKSGMQSDARIFQVLPGQKEVEVS